MADSLDLIASNPVIAHQCIGHAWTLAKALTIAGNSVRIRVDIDDDISIKQRRFLHGPVLGQIADQVRMPDGTRYTPQVWKEHLKDLFLPDRWDMVRLPFVKDRKTGEWKPSTRKAPVKRRKSTEELSVKQYSTFIDQCITHAATEWGVVFDLDPLDREAVRYVAPRKAKQQQAEEVAA